ncbi:hypothetical protein KR093_001084 [Drosophila rubida]|uniref:Uncharacterized protein n=1 Tax=Drosophila rubida TaxID=30044 RepID=A0AAD4K397_9MUSC|nr:hypothetical protein KR093_001084 [Drosophila rubida]
MDLPDDHIVNAFLQQPAGLRDALADEQENRELTGIWQQLITRELQPNNAHNGAGDGLHINQNQNQPDIIENRRPYFFWRRRFYSKFWHYVPMVVLMSSIIIKCILSVFGVDTQSATLLGISYKSHLNILQWIVLISTYYFKSTSR